MFWNKLRLQWLLSKFHDLLLLNFRLAGKSGQLRKDDFIRVMRSSAFFVATFDKNKDGLVTEVK
jgi:hypothetical protein